MTTGSEGGAYKYDVAFSFLNEDLALAEQLADLLLPTLEVFVYSRKQRRLAGTDGVESFAAIFKRETRLVVLLYRKGYGEERWTRMESGALRERHFDLGGWPFLLFVTLEENPQPPPYLPKTHLWFNHHAFGSLELLGAIRYRVQELGATPRIETPRARAARLARTREREEERSEILSSPRGIQLARHELERLRKRMENEARAIAADLPALELSQFRGADHSQFDWTIRSPKGSLHLYWIAPNRMRLTNASLCAVEVHGLMVPDQRARGGPRREEPREIEFTLDRDCSPVWKTPWRDSPLTTDALADYLLERLLNRMHGKPPDDNTSRNQLLIG
jgi:hypothetical protein